MKTFIEKCQDRVGFEWREEDQAALVHHIAEIERTYQELIRRRDEKPTAAVPEQVRITIPLEARVR